MRTKKFRISLYLFMLAVMFLGNMKVHASIVDCAHTDHVSTASTAYDSYYGTLRMNPANYTGSKTVSPPLFGAYTSAWKADGFANGDEAASYMFDKVNAIASQYYVDDCNNEIKILYIGKVTFWRNSNSEWVVRNLWDFTNGAGRDKSARGEFKPLDEKYTLASDVNATPIKNYMQKSDKAEYKFNDVTFADKATLDSFISNYLKNTPLANTAAVKSAQQYLWKYSPKTATVLPLTKTIDITGTKSIYQVDFTAFFTSNFVNTQGLSVEPQTGMGINVKNNESFYCETLGTGYYMPFVVTVKFKDKCDVVAATDPTNADYENYWVREGKADDPLSVKYTPKQLMDACTCGIHAETSFAKFIDNNIGGTYSPVKSSSEMKISCSVEDKCSITDYNAGKYSTAKTKACCDAKASGFVPPICPDDSVPNQTYNLYCDEPINLNDTKTYNSIKNEVSDSNTACTITCSETGTPKFQQSPYAIAGQGFDYDWTFDTSRTCKATYKSTPSDWSTNYNAAVSNRVSSYSSYVTAQNEYESYAARCKTTHTVYYENDCCTGSIGQDAVLDPKTGVVITPAIPNTCNYDAKCTSKVYCNDPNITVGEYNAKKSELQATMSSLYSSYTAVKAIEEKYMFDKNTCDNWVNEYDINADFSLVIKENTTQVIPMSANKVARALSHKSTETSRNDIAVIDCPSGVITTSACTTIKPRIYSSWINDASYEYTFTYKYASFIDRLTAEISSTSTLNSYFGGYKYYTWLGTRTGQYNMDVIMNNDNFGAYKQWDFTKIKDTSYKGVDCWYDVDNLFAPDDEDLNYTKYGNLGFTFRTINLTKMFNDRTPGRNWNTVKAKELTKQIEATGEDIYKDKTPLYKITITPEAMTKVREYTHKVGNEYSAWNKFVYDGENGTSGFLSEITSSNAYGVKMIRSDD